ncbi:MAG: bifunctional metallophosphatase/5'-nucleotidase [Thermaceae bacterium]|nr:bifunctional metallophosphatase/5'-nucleotidase [Thermaceae bacterium]
MSRFTILHTNDIHGRVEGLARIATLVEQICEGSSQPVLYFDAGDVEESSRPISRYTKGTAMHRLLDAVGCDLGAVGNGGFLSYGPQVLARYAEAIQHPLVLANLRRADGSVNQGVQPAVLLEVAGRKLGVIGLTDPFKEYEVCFGLKALDPVPLIKKLAAELRSRGAGAMILLSHMGFAHESKIDDRELAMGLDGEIGLIIGAHTHDLLPAGERVGSVWIAQAGSYAEHLGRIELEWIENRLEVRSIETIPVPEDVPQSPKVLAELEVIEREVDEYLSEPITELPARFDYASDRECASANLMADMLRQRLNTEVGLVTAGAAFAGSLPGGLLTRGRLLEVCYAPCNPTTIDMKGWMLEALIHKGLEPEFASEKPNPLRGIPRGLMHLSGARVADGKIWVGETFLDPERTYKIAGSDWELQPYGGYVQKDWNLQPNFEVPTILAEALEEYLTQKRDLKPETGRLG